MLLFLLLQQSLMMFSVSDIKRDQITSKCESVLQNKLEDTGEDIYCLSVVSTATCYNERGRFYQGTMNVTRSGTPCQDWSQQVRNFLLVLHVSLQTIQRGAEKKH